MKTVTIEQLYDLFLAYPQVTTDSRRAAEGSIFFALRGEHFDGNQYAAECLQQGCAYVVVDNADVVPEDDGRYLLVDDVLRTLQLLAAHHRRKLATTIIGITGTNGKTTTKELTSAVLRRKYNILATEGNLNNQIGVPLTLLRLTPQHDLAVVEMGANHPGDIRALVELVQPQYGLITNVGRAHLLGFGSFEGVCRTKAELYDFLRHTQGTAFLNTDDQQLVDMLHQGTVNTLPYVGGTVVPTSDVCITAQLDFGTTQLSTSTHLVGAYNINNVRAAATVGRAFNVTPADIIAAIADYQPTNNRSQFVETQRGNRLVVDAYNANPTSMAAALDNFAQMAGTPKMCIIGMMGELGPDSRTEHQQLVHRLQTMSLAEVWLVGSAFSDIAVPTHFTRFDTVDDVKARLDTQPVTNHTILIKGSNSTRLFQLTNSL